MRLIIMGPPGSGKGTQAKALCQRLGLAHFATGDILREAVRQGTELGRQAKSFMDRGQYVPDSLVNDLVADRLRRDDRPDDFLLDGYPRTLAQAVSFDQVLRQLFIGLDAVILLNVPDEEIVSRISGRLLCPRDNSLYHVRHHPPKTAGLCDHCGGPLELRSDDQEGTIRERLRVFHETMPPVIDHYRHQGLLKEVSGQGSIQDVTNAILRLLGLPTS
jgi:adenylate kinase